MENIRLAARFRYFIFLIVFLLCCHLITRSQNFFIKEDSLNTLLNTRYTTISRERIMLISELLGRHLPDDPVFDSLKNLLIQEAEESRDRSLMGQTYNQIALAYLGYYGRSDLSEKGKPYTDKCFQIATESGLDEYKVAAYIRYARYFLNVSENQKSLDYNNQAISLASAMGSDSLLCLSYKSISEAWNSMANKLSEFQALLNERNFAERSKVKSLIERSLFDLGHFYESVNDDEKAKDFYTQCIRESRGWHLGYYVFISLERLGKTYMYEKNEKLGIAYFDKALAFSDSAGISTFKRQIYFDELNYYFYGVDPVKGFAFLDAHPELMVFVKKYGVEFQVNKLYAILESSKNKSDSALYYLKLALPYEYSQKGNFSEKYEFTDQMASVYQDLHRYDEENKALLLESRFADSNEDIYSKRDVALRLESVNYLLGDFKRSHDYLTQYNTYRDSIESLGKQKDLLSVEIQNANKRAEQQKKEDDENRRVRNNIEYMGITAVIATVFIVLVVLGVFKISPAVIRALGFFAFIFLFEFIVLLLDDQIHALTHGEPWKVLAVKIVIISLLLPMHHWLEKNMTHYLTYKAHTIKSKIFNKKG